MRLVLATTLLSIALASDAKAVEIELRTYPAVDAKSSLYDKSAAEFTLGSNISRVREILASSYASFKIKDWSPGAQANISIQGQRVYTDIRPFLRTIHMSHSSTEQTEDWALHLTSPTTNSRLYAVVRKVSYPPGAKIAPPDILESAVSRYGAPQVMTETEVSWFYKHNGASNEGWEACRTMSGQIQSWLSAPNKFLDTYEAALRYTNAKCGGVISLSVSKDGDGLASGFRFLAYDGTLDVSDRYNVFLSMKTDLENAAAEAEAGKARPPTPKF